MIKRTSFKYFKTSPEIFRLAVMIYLRFPLSLRNLEGLLHECGVESSHVTYGSGGIVSAHREGRKEKRG